MNRIYTVDETAAMIRKGRTFTWGLIRNGELRSFKIGARRVVSQAAINDYIKRAQAESGCDEETEEVS